MSTNHIILDNLVAHLPNVYFCARGVSQRNYPLQGNDANPIVLALLINLLLPNQQEEPYNILHLSLYEWIEHLKVYRCSIQLPIAPDMMLSPLLLILFTHFKFIYL